MASSAWTQSNHDGLNNRLSCNSSTINAKKSTRSFGQNWLVNLTPQKIRFGQVNVFRFGAWDSHCSHQIDTACPIKAGECWAMGVITCRKNCDAKFLLRGKSEINLENNHPIKILGNRGKFKRCIYKQMKIYEKQNTGVVAENCSIFSEN